MTTVSDAVAETIADHTDEVFALMGNGNAHLADALARQKRVHITGVRHEAATVASADAYHRISRRIAVATTTYGPGYTNALTPLAEAAMSRTPLVVVVGGEPTTGPRPWDVDQTTLAQAVGARTVTATKQTPRAATRQAFEIANSERLPVVLSVPYDLAAAEADDETITWAGTPLPSPTATPPAKDNAAAAARLLASAHRPLVLAGRGAREAAAELGALADRIGALTVSSAPARGIFAGREWDLGVCGGFAAEDSSKLIRQADVVLVVGAGLNQFTMAFGSQFAPEATVIQVDIETSPTNPRVDRFLHGNAKDVVVGLLEFLPATVQAKERWDGIAAEARNSRLTYTRDSGTGQAADGRLDPRTVMSRLNEILPANRQVVTDGGHFIGWPSYYFELPAPDSLTMVGTHFQSIGLGFPSAPGALRARPDATTVLVTGDGGGIMGLPDLDSLVRTAHSAIVLVLNDACYGAEIHQYGAQGLDEKIMEIDQADFSRLAEGFGATGAVVETMDDLDRVNAWVQDGAHGTLVVDIRISRSIVAPFLLEIIEATLKK
ncbi:thiamine pyrophosphate-binding protein [Arthrobacter globiformis]|uniref:thiamine pyrophosphate-binding protein n=1 Tax=Arthrobacter globiformis TaxID=1665 RepID=UPI000B4186A2|nr:thiamine pyrophosphate-binding protein [Arthrobacter globiformis]